MNLKQKIPVLDHEILKHYDLGNEADRLLQFSNWERIRTEDILQRFLPPTPSVILDVGGAAGVYAFPLASRGYKVHIIDPVPLHIEQANAFSIDKMPETRLASAQVGDARELPFPGAIADAVLFFGPLYHLVTRADRIRAIQEAYRVLKTGGTLLAVGISRFASFVDGIARELVRDPEFVKILDQDLESGQHRNTTGKVEYFTTAFLHHPDELQSEIEEGGFKLENILGIEGPVWNVLNLESHWASPKQRELILAYFRRIESERTLVGASAHIMAIGRKV